MPAEGSPEIRIADVSLAIRGNNDAAEVGLMYGRRGSPTARRRFVPQPGREGTVAMNEANEA